MVTTKQFLADLATALADMPDGCPAMGLALVDNSNNSFRVRSISNMIDSRVALQMVGYLLWRGCHEGMGVEFAILLDKFKEITLVEPTQH